MVRKGMGREADEVVLDLEDAVVPEAKDDARAMLERVLAEDRPSATSSIAVRVNAPRTPWSHADLIAVARLRGSPP